MIEAPTPIDDEQRINALESTCVLDVGSEERFDRFTRLAQRMFNAPIALISLVHRESQFFKSVRGLKVTTTPRASSICGHAILGDDIFVVNDATKDSRFFDNPLVTGEPFIRFYAGCPLQSSDGYRLGSFCVIDRVPREFTDADVEALTDLGALVSAELSTLRLATIDELTGISNRRGFNMIADQAVQLCRRSNRQASLLMLNLDGFASINQQLGSAYGDKALVEFAQLLGDGFRESDVVAHLGGDSFCVLLTDTDFEHTWTSVERFRATLANRNDLRGRRYRLMFSAAVVQCDFDRHESTSRLLQDAEVLMHERKRAKPLGSRRPSVVA